MLGTETPSNAEQSPAGVAETLGNASAKRVAEVEGTWLS